MGSLLDAFIALDKAGRRRYLRTAFMYPPAIVTWRNHGLRVPLGLVVQEDGYTFLRMLWMDAKLQVRSRGMTVVAAATLAAAAPLGTITAIETWHLRDRERRFFYAEDLRMSLDRLDRVLTLAEGRLDTLPAAA